MSDIDDGDDWWRMPFPPVPYSAEEIDPASHPPPQTVLPTQPFGTHIYAPIPYSAAELRPTVNVGKDWSQT